MGSSSTLKKSTKLFTSQQGLHRTSCAISVDRQGRYYASHERFPQSNTLVGYYINTHRHSWSSIDIHTYQVAPHRGSFPGICATNTSLGPRSDAPQRHHPLSLWSRRRIYYGARRKICHKDGRKTATGCSRTPDSWPRHGKSNKWYCTRPEHTNSGQSKFLP